MPGTLSVMFVALLHIDMLVQAFSMGLPSRYSRCSGTMLEGFLEGRGFSQTQDAEVAPSKTRPRGAQRGWLARDIAPCCC